MKTSSTLTLMALSLLVSCQPPLKHRPSQEKSEPEALIVNKELSYKYTLKGRPSDGDNQVENGTSDGQDKACSTGLQTFENKKDLCIALQDNKLNNDCAFFERAARFNWDCEETLGWKWDESVQCDVYALRGKKLEIFLKKEDIISKTSFCAGRTESKDWDIVSEVKDEFNLYQGIKFNITLRSQDDENHGDYGVKFKITRPDGLVSGETSTNGNIVNSHEEDLFGEDARLHVACYSTYGCRNQ